MAFKVDLIRPDDLLNLHIEGVNLQVNPGSGEQASIIRRSPLIWWCSFPLRRLLRAFFETNTDTKKLVGADLAMRSTD